MCGIAGYLACGEGVACGPDPIRRMLSTIHHRGPDQFGIYRDHSVALASARLSIIDIENGQQPIPNEDETLWIVFNGEVFNYLELRRELERRGHRFATRTDTEVVLHLFEELGPECLKHLNGQFAMAIWDTRARSLFLARDRVGIRPLFYTEAKGALVFASEVKALLAYPGVSAEIDPVALDQVFQFWSTLPGRTIFQGIREVPPGHYLMAREGARALRRYWQIQFEPSEPVRNEQDYVDEFGSLLADATTIRLRADVPVGAYLSGGLDSSSIAAMVMRHNQNHLNTFSIAFSDPAFDESGFQRSMARFLGTGHQLVEAGHGDIARVFPEVIWHTETPVMRTAPAPMFLLSKRVRECGFKVVLTGEGADEFLAGYDIFKESMVRRFWARQPESVRRPALLRRLYADIPNVAATGDACRAAFFRGGLEDTGCPYYSHAVRWRNNGRTRRFFSPAVRDAAVREGACGVDAIEYPAEFAGWGPLERAQYLEAAIFLPQYLLSSQGDRVAMAHGVESRMPFLDYRVVEFCNRLPAANETARSAREASAARSWQERCCPERSGTAPSGLTGRLFTAASSARRHRSMCGTCFRRAAIKATGLFSPEAVGRLVAKIERGLPVGETDDMALAGMISTQLVHHLFSGSRAPAAAVESAAFKTCGPAEVLR